jgi:superfamily II DNA/RNA helicase
VENNKMKAHVKTPEGIEIQLDGTSDELAAVLKDLKIKNQSPRSSGSTAKTRKAKKGKQGVHALIDSLKQDGFFKKPRTLNDIRLKLKDLGHNYPLTSLSGRMGQQVRKGNLKRFKENKKYVYAQ